MEYLPQDLIYEMVLRLPVKCLIRFSFVSKLWKAVIHSKDFIRKHRQRFNLNHLNDFALIRHHVESDPHDHFYSVAFSGDDTTLEEERLKHPLYSLEESDRLGLQSGIVALCNGLILLHVRSKKYDLGLFLWNPMISKHKMIPTPFKWARGKFSNRMYGLGYHSAEDDLKVLVLTEDYNNRSNSLFGQINLTMDLEVYSVALNRWKRIEKLPPSNLRIYVNHQSNMVSMNDSCVAWLMRDNDQLDLYMVVTFDLVKEEYQFFRVPILIRGPGVVKLMAFGGFLCFLRCYTGDCINVWFTKDCDSCWSLEPVVLNCEPLFFDGERFLLNQLNHDGNDRLTWYNIKTQKHDYGTEIRRHTRSNRCTETTLCVGDLSLLLDADPDGRRSYFGHVF
ncbi:F-box protein CPR1-like [Rosa sericea]